MEVGDLLIGEEMETRPGDGAHEPMILAVGADASAQESRKIRETV